jgi:glutamate-5-semialdehyde dehydrogenase
MDIASYMDEVGKRAKHASRLIARAESQTKNDALRNTAVRIREKIETVLAANRLDLERAEASGLDAAMIDRLTLTEKSIGQMAEGVEQVASLADPIGEISGL